MQPKYLGDHLGLERVSICEQPLREGIRRERLSRFKRVVLGAEGTAWLRVAPFERNLADVEARGHLVDSRAEAVDRWSLRLATQARKLSAERVRFPPEREATVRS
jgi:hypothetical protein